MRLQRVKRRLHVYEYDTFYEEIQNSVKFILEEFLKPVQEA